MRTACNSQRISLGGLLSAAVAILLSGCLAPANRPPVARCDVAPSEGYAPLTVRLDGGRTVDPDGDRLTYEWAFSDGATADGRSIVRSFGEGEHTATLLVTDPHGGIDDASATITVRPVPDGFIVRHYEWIHDGESLEWSALLPYNLYQTYRGRLRIPLVDNYDYPAYVLDPLDDPTLEELASVLWDRAGGKRDAFVEWALSFVQGAIAYALDPSNREWPLYPIETLVDAAGDCEDTAILLVSLLRAMGVESQLAAVDTDDDSTPDHVLVLVAVSEAYAVGLGCVGGESLTIFSLDGALYAVAETAVESGPLGLGCDPWGLEVEDLIETWSFD